MTTYQNVCIKCGKLRIEGSVVEEKINNSVVSYREMVCPDADCQKKVQEMLFREDRKKRDAYFLKLNSKRPGQIHLGPKDPRVS